MASSTFGPVGWQGFKPTLPATNNPFSTISNVKSPLVDSRLADLFKSFDTLGTMGTGAIGSYTSALNAATPRLTSFVNSDIGAINDIASGKTSAELAQIRADRAAAIKLSADRARAGITGALAQTQLSMGGGGRSLGTGSYVNKLGLDKLVDVAAKTAADNADQTRNDYAYNESLRLGTLGQRGSYLDALSGRNLLPLQASNTQYSTQQQQLAQLLQQFLGNNFVGLSKPYLADNAPPVSTIQGGF